VKLSKVVIILFRVVAVSAATLSVVVRRGEVVRYLFNPARVPCGVLTVVACASGQ
jgi:hypothetical protein